MLLFIGRLLSHIIVFLFFLLPLQLIGAIVLLFVLPFIPDDQIKLPAFVRWFDNADTYLGRDTSAYELVCAQGWWARYIYIAWRNPLNYFEYKYAGLHWEGNEIYARYFPSESSVGDASQDHAGWRHIEVIKPSVSVAGVLMHTRYFEYYWVYQYPFKKNVCFRFRCGWKIKDMNNPKGTLSQFVLVVSPWKAYSGR